MIEPAFTSRLLTLLASVAAIIWATSFGILRDFVWNDLRSGMLRLDGASPLSTRISRAKAETLKANNLTDGYIRLVVSRGFGDLGLSPKNCPTPSIICIADSIKLYPEELYTTGMKIITSPTRRISPAALPPMIKSLDRRAHV